MKRLLIFAILMIVLTLSGCASTPNVDDSTLTHYTLAELSQYDGQDGADAYIAVDGYIYDVTNDPNWHNGVHNGFTAGQDLTEAINTFSPHGTSVLSGVPIVGILDDPNSN